MAQNRVYDVPKNFATKGRGDDKAWVPEKYRRPKGAPSRKKKPDDHVVIKDFERRKYRPRKKRADFREALGNRAFALFAGVAIICIAYSFLKSDSTLLRSIFEASRDLILVVMGFYFGTKARKE